MIKVIVIVGPTAIGKSSLAIEIAQKHNGSIISGDSISIYKGLNIASAKTPLTERKGITHYLIDEREITDKYSVADFQKEGRDYINKINQEHKLPIIVGGTGLYIKALLYDYNFIEDKKPHTDYPNFSNEQLYQKLLSIDEVSAKKIDSNNRQRLVRALNICESGHKKSEIEEQQNHDMLYDALIVGLTIKREKLRNMIDDRVDEMVVKGLEEEAKKLYDNNIEKLACGKAIGYKEFVDYFNNKQSLEETIAQIKTHTKQFAKRQYTWFNHQMPVNWYDIEEDNYIQKIERDICEFIRK